jgi:hypothetical protein
VRLACGADIVARLADDGPRAGPVTVVVRPEQLIFDPAGASGAFSGLVETVVYTGNDMQFHAVLDKGTTLIARMPVRIGEAAPAQGTRARFALADGAAHVLKD